MAQAAQELRSKRPSGSTTHRLAPTFGGRGSGRRRKASALEGRIVTAEGSIQPPMRKTLVTLPGKNSDHEADEKWRVAVTRHESKSNQIFSCRHC